jgi:hypothetical protein
MIAALAVHEAAQAGPVSPIALSTSVVNAGEDNKNLGETKPFVIPATPGHTGTTTTTSDTSTKANEEDSRGQDNDINKYELPKCTMPPQSELEPIETFVSNAIRSKHDLTDNPTFKEGYRAIANALRRPEDPLLLKMVLLSLRTAGKGSTLYQLTTSATTHAQLTHLIFRLNSFQPIKLEDESEEKLQPYRDYSLADAHLNLMVALVSAKSVHAVPAMTVAWRMLTHMRSDAPEQMYVFVI